MVQREREIREPALHKGSRITREPGVDGLPMSWSVGEAEPTNLHPSVNVSGELSDHQGRAYQSRPYGEFSAKDISVSSNPLHNRTGNLSTIEPSSRVSSVLDASVLT